MVLEDETIENVNFEIVRPGESCRAGPIFDIVQPRAKEPGSSPDFPGILGPPATAGVGTTHVLGGSCSFSSGRTISGRIEECNRPGFGDDWDCRRSDGVLFASTPRCHPSYASRIADSYHRQGLPYSGLKSRRLPWPRRAEPNSGIYPDIRPGRSRRGRTRGPAPLRLRRPNLFPPAETRGGRADSLWRQHGGDAADRYSIPTNGWTEPLYRRCSPGSVAPRHTFIKIIP